MNICFCFLFFKQLTLFIYLFIYLFMAVLGLRFCARAFSSCGKRRPLFIAVRGPLTIAASLVAEHRLQTRKLSNCGSRAQLLRGVWDLPRPGLRTHIPCIGRQILNHCATRGALAFVFLSKDFLILTSSSLFLCFSLPSYISDFCPCSMVEGRKREGRKEKVGGRKGEREGG